MMIKFCVITTIVFYFYNILVQGIYLQQESNKTLILPSYLEHKLTVRIVSQAELLAQKLADTPYDKDL
ncbi:MAG: hypothetical protein GKC53_05405 [Neisseriaceae bacterium]|nr:MAG: hypothetical protein GKC53_05405 [Neisseriaceae bacterium]